MKRIKQWLAARKLRLAGEALHRDRVARLSTYEIQDFTKRRAAMLRYTRRDKSCQA